MLVEGNRVLFQGQMAVIKEVQEKKVKLYLGTIDSKPILVWTLDKVCQEVPPERRVLTPEQS